MKGEAGARGEVPDTPKPGDPVLAGVTNVVIGNNGLVVTAAVEEAHRLGLTPCLLTRSLQGEAREVARVFGAVLDEIAPFSMGRTAAGDEIVPLLGVE